MDQNSCGKVLVGLNCSHDLGEMEFEFGVKSFLTILKSQSEICNRAEPTAFLTTLLIIGLRISGVSAQCRRCGLKCADCRVVWIDFASYSHCFVSMSCILN